MGLAARVFQRPGTSGIGPGLPRYVRRQSVQMKMPVSIRHDIGLKVVFLPSCNICFHLGKLGQNVGAVEVDLACAFDGGSGGCQFVYLATYALAFLGYSCLLKVTPFHDDGAVPAVIVCLISQCRPKWL